MSDIYPLREFENVSLAIMPRPRAGDWLEDEIASWHRTDIRTVVSLLEPYEVDELGLKDEARLCASNGIEFVSFPIPDRGVPTSYERFQLSAEVGKNSTRWPAGGYSWVTDATY